MRLISEMETQLVAGGYMSASDESSEESCQHQSVVEPVVIITGTKQQVDAAKATYEDANNIGNAIGAVVGAATGLVVLAACEAATAGAGTPACVVIAGAVGTYVTSSVTDGAKGTFTKNL